MTFQTRLRCSGPERYLAETDGHNGQVHLSGTRRHLSTDTYICGDCGYVTQDSLPLLRQHTVKVTPAD